MKTNKCLVTTLATILTFGAFAQTVDELVNKHIAALGGQDKLSSVKTLVLERTISVQGMDIPSKSTLVVGKALRSESSVMGNIMVQVVDGSTGWMIRPAMMGGSGDPEDMPAEVLKQQTDQLDPFGPLVGYKEKGNQVELLGKEKLDGKDAYHLKITTKEGNVMEEYLNADTYLVSKMKRGGIDGQPAEITISDYKDFDGIKFARSMEMAGGQMGTLTFTTDKVKVNEPIDDKVFKKPVK
ncbi:hypothetical protein GCM10023187_16810 [Nibrella viscosa]|uniref:Uncharacterized protein TP-0789 domain-containing protein n=1 Tax=Nibrella viscosa TaxID=1084524 RepID=A0ABP8K873_9BACT